MIALPYKAKNYAWFALKVGILLISFYYLYLKLADQQLYWNPWLSKLMKPKFIGIVIALSGMSAANWLLEAKKWQLLVNTFKMIPFKEALSQSLAALTVSLPTPSRLGEYAAKAYYYSPKERKRIVFLNALGNLAQMTVTCCFGIIGLLIYRNQIDFKIEMGWLIGFLLAMALLSLIVHHIGKEYSMFRFLNSKKIRYRFTNLSSSVKLGALSLSLGRYILFSTQFYLILLLFGAEISAWESLPMIYIMYLMVSILPMFPFLDIVVKGSAAVWLFQTIGVDEYTVLATTLGVWVLNLVIPSIFGSFPLIKAPN